MEAIFRDAKEKVISINGCAIKVDESTDISCDDVKGCEVLSVIASNSSKSAKNNRKPETYLSGDKSCFKSAISSAFNEGEKSDLKDQDENFNSKTSSEGFDSDWEFKQDTVKIGKEQLFLSLSTHNGKLLSFSDNDQKHGKSIPHIVQTKGTYKTRGIRNMEVSDNK